MDRNVHDQIQRLRDQVYRATDGCHNLLQIVGTTSVVSFGAEVQISPGITGSHDRVILAVRPCTPRDTAKVQVAQRWMSRQGRTICFWGAPVVRQSGCGASHADPFATLDRPNLHLLPAGP
jgi:hypothetical protein